MAAVKGRLAALNAFNYISFPTRRLAGGTGTTVSMRFIIRRLSLLTVFVLMRRSVDYIF